MQLPIRDRRRPLLGQGAGEDLQLRGAGPPPPKQPPRMVPMVHMQRLEVVDQRDPGGVVKLTEAMVEAILPIVQQDQGDCRVCHRQDTSSSVGRKETRPDKAAKQTGETQERAARERHHPTNTPRPG